MSEHMGAIVEVWPLAADTAGIWLLSGDAPWRSGRIPADNEPHSELDYLMWERGARDTTMFAHSTSWRVDGPHVVLTYVAVVRVEDLVRDHWPDAQPVSLSLANAVGSASAGPALEAPTPRDIDVLLHAIRHLRFLLDTDVTAQQTMADPWPRHLQQLQPALAGMYSAKESPHVMPTTPRA